MVVSCIINLPGLLRRSVVQCELGDIEGLMFASIPKRIRRAAPAVPPMRADEDEGEGWLLGWLVGWLEVRFNRARGSLF